MRVKKTKKDQLLELLYCLSVAERCKNSNPGWSSFCIFRPGAVSASFNLCVELAHGPLNLHVFFSRNRKFPDQQVVVSLPPSLPLSRWWGSQPAYRHSSPGTGSSQTTKCNGTSGTASASATSRSTFSPTGHAPPPISSANTDDL